MDLKKSSRPELSGDTLLHRAVRMGKSKLVSTLLGFGAKVDTFNARGFDSSKPLNLRHLPIAKALEFHSIHKRIRVESKQRGKSLVSALMGADPVRVNFRIV